MLTARSLGSRGAPALPYDRSTRPMTDDSQRSARAPDEFAQAEDLFRRMPKAELHLHLDGSLRPSTALELARERGLDGGMDLAAIAERLSAPEQVADQAELLRAFDLPIALMQDAESLTRITRELVEDVAGDGTRYAEIRWGPALHVAGGMGLGESIHAVASGAESGAAATGAVVRLIAVALRSHLPATNLAVAREATRFVGRGLVGFDLAGPEEAFPDPLLHREALDAARDGGLAITIHAGEWGGAEQVRRALAVRPSRIAHGAPAIDDPLLVDDLAGREITLDLAPTSNVQASIFPSLSTHPIARLHRAGVKVTLSTDDRTVSSLDLVREYMNCYSVLGMSAAELWSVNMHALKFAFLDRDEAVRAALIADFEDFAAHEPLLADRRVQ